MKSIVFLFIVLFSQPLFSQDTKLGRVTRTELEMKFYDKDSIAGAVVLDEVGKFSCTDYTSTFTLYRRVKILNKQYSSLGSITVVLLESFFLAELEAVAYNLVIGEIQVSYLCKDMIYKV